MKNWEYEAVDLNWRGKEKDSTRRDVEPGDSVFTRGYAVRINDGRKFNALLVTDNGIMLGDSSASDVDALLDIGVHARNKKGEPRVIELIDDEADDARVIVRKGLRRTLYKSVTPKDLKA